MKFLAHLFTAFVALEHLYILWMEMFAWETVGKRTFKTLPAELFKPTKSLAANQGLYNGFLSAGLIWSFFPNDILWQQQLRIFFLGCVIVAGIFGAVTASKRIFYVQALPAIVALLLVLLS